MKNTRDFQKSSVIFLTTVILLLLFVFPVSADMGPKPSVTVTVNGVGDADCYITLLSVDDQYGPWSSELDYEDYMGDYDVWQTFSAYDDPDGYFFINNFGELEDGKFEWGYYPPKHFKILLYFPENGAFAVSGIFERVNFDTYLAIDLDMSALDADSLTVVDAYNNYDHLGEILAAVVRAILTILIEVGIAFLFGYRKRQIAVIAVTNVLTQALLNTLLYFINFRYGIMYFYLNYILFEVIVVIIECIVYSKSLYLLADERKKDYPCVYAIVANILSFIAGIYLSFVLPQIF